MKSLITKLVWVLMLALPWQAFAQAHMSLCMAMMNSSAPRAIKANELNPAAPVSSGQADCAGHSASKKSDRNASNHEQGTCSQCALCALGAVVAANFPLLTAELPTMEPFAQPESFYIDAELTALDDPPRP